jgi:integrase
MESEARATKTNDVHGFDSWGQFSGGAAVEMHSDQAPSSCPPARMPGIGLIPSSESKSEPLFETNTTRVDDHTDQASPCRTSIAEFVERKFIPEYVATKKSAGRSYFRGILNHVLPPEQVARAFATNLEKTNNKLTAVPGWPYIGSLRLCDIDAETIQLLTTTALKHGYSTQTATHIRNVIRLIFSHAIRTGCYIGNNPANLVTLPIMTRKKAHTLSIYQLQQVMQAMRYPEKEITFFLLLTEMRVAEICGLQWKYINDSNVSRLLEEEESVPPRTIAIRYQCYRGELSVSRSRRKLVSAPHLLCLVLRDLKNRTQFTAPDDFVFISRNGTPIHQENVTARRLKFIGKTFEMPWLSWSVFHRTRFALKSSDSLREFLVAMTASIGENNCNLLPTSQWQRTLRGS